MAARYAASLPLLLRHPVVSREPDLQAGTVKRASQGRILDLSDDSRPDSYLGDGICRAAGVGLWQLSERVPEPLAGRRKHRHAAIALPQVRARTRVVGKCAAGELGGAAGAVPGLRDADRVAVCAVSKLTIGVLWAHLAWQSLREPGTPIGHQMSLFRIARCNRHELSS